MSVQVRTEDLNACAEPCAHEWNSRTAKCEGEGTGVGGGSWNVAKEGEAETTEGRGKGGGATSRAGWSL